MRNSHVTLLSALLFSALAMLALECSSPERMAGTVTQSGNGRVTGVLVTATGAPASGTPVQLIPSDLDPVVDNVLLPKDTTDTAGRYAFDGVSSGVYNIVAIQPDRKSAVEFGIKVRGDTVMVLQDTMRIPGTIRVAVPAGADTAGGYFYVPGTTIFTRLAGINGYAILASVPAGVALPVYYNGGNGTSLPRLVRDSITVIPGNTTTVEYVDWKYTKKINLNTTASGAQVAADVMDFPVLVRLTSNNFVFSEAGKNGDDLRFTKSDGTVLPYEIERWDSAGGLAEIWVRVDTVLGNSSSQTIMMYWGLQSTSSATVSLSNGSAVFDTSASCGFQGVWHLSEPAGAMARDATGNHFDGTPSDTAPAVTSGPLGIAKQFSGMSSYFDMKNTASGKLNFPENGTYTVSAWVYADSLNDSSHLIIGKGNEQYYLKQKFTPNLKSQTWEFVEFQNNSGWQITDYPSSAHAWTYITGVRSGGSQYLYINGLLVDNVPGTNAPSLARDTTQDVTIGKYLQFVASLNEGFCPFKGKIDEVRISNVSRSADWEKLCYMNQKTDDALVIFK